MEDNYEYQQAAWLKHSGVKVGDTVRCISIATDSQCGWNQPWVNVMQVGDSGTVLEIHPINGVAVA